MMMVLLRLVALDLSKRHVATDKYGDVLPQIG